MIYIGFLIRCFDCLFCMETSSFFLSGSSYKTVPDRLPILVCQVYLSQFQPVG